jgi:hypothetical protein
MREPFALTGAAYRPVGSENTRMSLMKKYAADRNERNGTNKFLNALLALLAILLLGTGALFLASPPQLPEQEPVVANVAAAPADLAEPLPIRENAPTAASPQEETPATNPRVQLPREGDLELTLGFLTRVDEVMTEADKVSKELRTAVGNKENFSRDDLLTLFEDVEQTRTSTILEIDALFTEIPVLRNEEARRNLEQACTYLSLSGMFEMQLYKELRQAFADELTPESAAQIDADFLRAGELRRNAVDSFHAALSLLEPR